MTPTILTNYAHNQHSKTQKEIAKLEHSIGFSGVMGASKERIAELYQRLRYYQLVLAQQKKEGV